MIWFLTTRGHEYTVKHLVRGKMEGEKVPPCSVKSYDRFLSHKKVVAGTYIFTDIERLTPWEIRLAAEGYAALAGDVRCRVLNNPARIMARYELLRNLQAEGFNDFEVIRADERRWPEKYPVFLRHEQDHGKPLSLDLWKNREELAAALADAQAQGISLRGLLIIGYAAEAFEGPWFIKYNTFRVADAVFAHHAVLEDSWNVKYGNPNKKLPEEHKVFEQKFVFGNRYVDILRRVFDIAHIEYGRADFGVVAGRPQIYEINTNPYISADPGSESPTRRATIAMSTKRLCESLANLETQRIAGTGMVRIGGPRLDDWRRKRKWFERPETRP
jgi:hypothetical protein